VVTKEEGEPPSRPKIALSLTRPMTPAEEDEFCQIANGRLNYQSNTDQTREMRAWVKRRPEVRTLISNAVAIFARHSAKCPHRAENNNKYRGLVMAPIVDGPDQRRTYTIARLHNCSRRYIPPLAL
jgi:hypothetical protein